MRKRFERFCFRHRNKGIPNLMLYIVLGNALVYLMSIATDNFILYNILCFDRSLILQGQVWRLFSFIFTSFTPSNLLLTAISYLCYYSIGRAIENLWGTFRFNLFYLSGVVMMAVFAMCLGGIRIPVEGFGLVDCSVLYESMGTTLNLSLFLAYATLYPNTHFLLFFIIPVKAWIFALLDLILTASEIFSMTYPTNLFPHNLFPLVAIANYLLFFGKDVANILPVTWRANFLRLFRKKKKKDEAAPKTIPFPSAGSYQASVASVKAPYTHRCTVCGRTDASDPDLEFRYCSRCNGYYCYCADHISNHTHIE